MLFNIFGGITRCDEVARGLIEAFDQIKPDGAVRGAARRHERRGGPRAARRGGPARTCTPRRRCWAPPRRSWSWPADGILVDQDTKLVVSGITGREGTFHSLRNRDYGTNVVGGRDARQGRPGRGGHPGLQHVPRRRSRRPAPTRRWSSCRRGSPPTRSSRPRTPASRLIITITEGIPAHDELRVYNHLQRGELAADRPELPRHPLARQGERRDHPGAVLQGGQRRARVALRHAHLPDRQRAGPARLRQLVDRRHRRRPGARARASSTCIELFEADPRDRADRDVRRDRRQRRGGGRRLHRRATCRSRCSPTSPASRRRPARRWATPARSCPARRAPRRRRRRRWRRRACAWGATPRRSRRSPSRSWARASSSRTAGSTP